MIKKYIYHIELLIEILDKLTVPIITSQFFHTFSVWSLETHHCTCLRAIGLYHCITTLVIHKRLNSLLQCLLRWQKDVQWVVMVMVNVFWEGVNANQATEEMTAVKVRRTFFTSKVIVAIYRKVMILLYFISKWLYICASFRNNKLGKT